MTSQNRKILLVTFSDNSDHQDITFGMYEAMYPQYNIWLMCIKNPRAQLSLSNHTKLVDCPKRPGVNIKTFDVFELFKIIRWIRHERFDVIFFESLHVWNLAIMLMCKKNVCIYQIIHDLIPHEGDRSAKQVELMNKIVCKISDYIVLCNQKYLNKITELYSVAPVRAKYIDMWRRFPDYSGPGNPQNILFFGRINPYKGADNLLEIVDLCPDLHFTIMSKVDSQVEQIIEELKLRANVDVITGYVSNSEMDEAFINAGCVILPYNSATQSGVVIDAYRYGRPAIAFNVGAISEQIDENISGYLVEPNNNKAFAKKIYDVVTMKHDQYCTFCKAAYDFGKNKYSAVGAVERFLELIDT